jgi:hypothetical protein
MNDRRIPSVELHRVRSRGVRAIGYDMANSTLYVMFPDGDLYRYFRVSWQRVQALLAAESIGGYVNQRIKPAYECERVT